MKSVGCGIVEEVGDGVGICLPIVDGGLDVAGEERAIAEEGAVGQEGALEREGATCLRLRPYDQTRQSVSLLRICGGYYDLLLMIALANQVGT